MRSGCLMYHMKKRWSISSRLERRQRDEYIMVGLPRLWQAWLSMNVGNFESKSSKKGMLLRTGDLEAMSLYFLCLGTLHKLNKRIRCTSVTCKRLMICGMNSLPGEKQRIMLLWILWCEKYKNQWDSKSSSTKEVIKIIKRLSILLISRIILLPTAMDNITILY